MAPKKLEFIFGDVATTFRPEDIEAVLKEWEAANPGKKAERHMSSKEFADACMRRLAANARPARTVLHN